MVIKIDDNLYKRYEYFELLEEFPDTDLENNSFECDIDFEKSIFNKEDIILLLNCKSDKALKFLKLCFDMKYAIKIGNQYYIKRDDFDRFFIDFRGKEVVI